MFNKSAKYYDAIYLGMGKDYDGEADKVHAMIAAHTQSFGNLLLDVACGTGLHLGPLSGHYQVEGLDLDKEMLRSAKQKHPKIRFHHGDMLDFDLHRQFDAVTCLFSSIGYVKTLPNLEKAVK